MRPLKNLLLCTTAVVGVASVASAADLRMPVKAPPRAVAAPVATWTGCYVGGHLGGGWGRKEFSNGVISASIPSLITDSAGVHNTTVDTDGFLGGVQAGCNYQAYPNWVLGIEGTFTWSDLNGSAGAAFDPFFAGKGGGPGSATLEVKTEWLATLVGRLGYAQNNWMLYGLVGLAWAHDKYRAFGNASINIAGPTTVAFDFGGSEDRSGYVLGVGLATLLWTGWTGFVEYNFLDFGSRRVTLTGSASPIGFPVSGSGAVAADVDQEIHVIKAGLNWRFGGFGKAPVVAKY